MFNGSFAALVTPFTERGELDLAAFDRLLDFHIGNGSDGLVIAGTTGESATLVQDEFALLLERAVSRVDGRLPVLAGTGSASTRKAVERTRLAAGIGADAALVVTPYYNRPPQRGLEGHFRSIADEAGLDLILYNVPSRTSVDMLPATVERLAAHPRIRGIKEAVPDPSRIEELVARCGEAFAVLSGDDGSCLEALRHGARGVVSVAANVAPERMSGLCRAADREEWEEAARMDSALRPLFDVLMIETNPIPVKWALFEMGLIPSGLRLPLTRLDQKHRETVRQCLQQQGLAGTGSEEPDRP